MNNIKDINNYSNEKKEIIKYINYNKKNLENKYTKWLYKNIKDGYKYVNKKKLCKNVIQLKNDRIITQNDGYFLTNIINSIIISRTKNQLRYDCKLLNREIIIYIGVEKEEIDYNYYKSLINRMLSILYILTKNSESISRTKLRISSRTNSRSNSRTMLKSICSEKLEIYIYLIDIRKKLPIISSEIIGKDNVNSGYSYYCKRSNKIVVYRKEEWFKVFIHECYHALGLHYNDYHNNTLNKIFNINNNIKINIMECYVEIWARILNTTSTSYLISKSYTTFKENINKMLNIERIFSCIQVSKILKHMDLIYKNLVNNKRTDVKDKYKENTNVFAYYILTAICLSNINDFFDWCKNNKIIQLYNLNKKTKKYKNIRRKTLKLKNTSLLSLEKQSLEDFIKNKYNDINLIRTLSHNYIHDINSNNGLRMSIIEYE